jgi:hypothetical protein
MNEGRTRPAILNAQDFRHEEDTLKPASDLVAYFLKYSRQKPEVVALWCLGVGFVLGWKLKPW